MENIIIQPVYCKYPNKNTTNPDNDFKIYGCNIVDKKKSEVLHNNFEISIKGNMEALNYNMQYNIIGELEENQWGMTIVTAYINSVFKEGDEVFQKQFLMQILTELQYNEFIKALDEPFKALKEKDIKLLTSVKGVGESTAYRLIDKYEQSIDYSQAVVKFGELGMSSTMINKIVRAYASPQMLIDKFEENPYILADDVDGIGFKTADEISLKSGIGELSDKRIISFIHNELKTTALNIGDTYMSTNDVYESWCEFSGYDDELNHFMTSLKEMISSDTVKVLKKGEFICLTRYYNHEMTIAEELMRLINAKDTKIIKNAEEKLNEVEEEQGFKFNDEQRSAILKIVYSNVLVISGAAGVGKSTVARGVVKLIGKHNSAATALSGKAGQRLSETTGIVGQTIHRLLGYNPNEGYKFNKTNQLQEDLIILDEASMVDVTLFRRLIESIKTGAKLVLLGDTNQLESIGAGSILHDIIDSEYVTSCELNTIHRQAQKSGIITVANKIRKAEHVIEKGFEGTEVVGELQDFEMIINPKAKSSPERKTKDLICNKFKSLLDDNEISDIQVIVPMKTRGRACVFELNETLQNIYNPFRNGDIVLECGKKKVYELRVGDKVICKKNNYKTENIRGEIIPIFNGSMGVVLDIDSKKQSMIIDFDNIGKIMIEKSIKGSIELAYAITVHSSQGSQWNNVIVGIDNSMFTMLNKELLYTAITRAQIQCTLIAENNALRMATRTSNIHNKRTMLEKFLKKINKK